MPFLQSLTLSCQLLLFPVYKSAVFLILKCKGSIDQIFGGKSDLEYLILNQKKKQKQKKTEMH